VSIPSHLFISKGVTDGNENGTVCFRFLPQDSTEDFTLDLSSYPSPIPKKPTPPSVPDPSEVNSAEVGGDDDDISFAIDDQDEIMIIESTASKAEEQMQEVLSGQASLNGKEDGPVVTGKKRTAEEAEIQVESPEKKKKVEKEEGEKEVEVVDLT